MNGSSSHNPDRQKSAGQGFVASYVTRPDDPLLERFFQSYDRAFILEAEKEDIDGLRACLALNDGPAHDRLSAVFGDFRETIILLTDENTGETLGGANFIVYRGLAEDPSVSLSYIFVDVNHRRKGHFDTLMALVREQCRDFTGQNLPAPFIYIEMNDPVRMDPADYQIDSQYTGLDQIDRLKIWQRRGARLVDIDYQQPPLSDRQGDDAALLLGILNISGAVLPACSLMAHLERFFAITVLKGGDPYSVPSASAQLSKLRTLCANGKMLALIDLDDIIYRSAYRS